MDDVGDGLVFVPDTPYIAGTDHSLLKWKARDQLTVDLTVRGAGKGEGLGFFAVDDDGENAHAGINNGGGSGDGADNNPNDSTHNETGE